MMHCEQFLDALSDLLDEELDPAAAAAARQHASGCASCAAVLASSQQMLGWMGDSQNFALPPAASVRLRERLEQHLEAARPQAISAGVPSAQRRGGSGSDPAKSDEPMGAASGSQSTPRRLRWAWLWLRPRWAAALVLILLVAGLARWRAGATTVSGWLIDQGCAVTYHAHPGDHTVNCLRHCAAKGVALGLLDAQGRFRRFDAHGEQSARAVIAATTRSNDMWVTVKARSASHGVLDVEQIALTTPPGIQ
ncbi:MAG TPA: zf-HC2 domain-containing protein [Terriglobales bacterium]|nr:zf-HC2 domain-containing protein [Terriglobales bacterium]